MYHTLSPHSRLGGELDLEGAVGRRIRTEILEHARAGYGEQVVETLSRQLTTEYGRGFGRRNLFHMIQFADIFQELEIVHALSAQLSWTHLRELIAIDDPLKRTFYVEMCRIERWSTRTLKSKINGMLYERTGISRKPAELASKELDRLRNEDQLTPDLVFRDPYLLDFLGLPETFSEHDLEAAILHDLERFLLELGTDFSFLARQKRMSIGPDDFYLDLLFFHRSLRCLVAIELKLGRFSAADKGQMELYLRWLETNELRPGENPPVGLILCAEKNREQIELLQLEHGSIRVAEYLTQLPPRELLQKKLHEAIALAHARQQSLLSAGPKAPP